MINIGLSPSETPPPPPPPVKISSISQRKIRKTLKASSTITRAPTPSGENRVLLDVQNKENSEFTATNSNPKNKTPKLKKSSINFESVERINIRRSLRSSTTPKLSPKLLTNSESPKMTVEVELPIKEKVFEEESIMPELKQVDKPEESVFANDIQPNSVSSPLKRKSPAKEKLDISIENNPQIKKKKKRLMSKSRFLLPQEKLISPAIKDDANHKGIIKKDSCIINLPCFVFGSPMKLV